MSKKICIVSHSGGLDSTTIIARAIAEGYHVLPINFNYGQKNIVEMAAQKNIYRAYKEMYVDRLFEPMVLDLNTFMDSQIRSFKKLRDSGEISNTTELEYYMPFRNLTFASICAMIGELLAIEMGDVDEIAIGIGVHKHSGEVYEKDYWDITPKFVAQLDAILNLNDSIKVTAFAPYVDCFKEDIIRDAVELEVPYLKTWTCYDPVYSGEETIIVTPCKKCEACIERYTQGIKAGVKDINEYSIELISEKPKKLISLNKAEIVNENILNHFNKVI